MKAAEFGRAFVGVPRPNPVVVAWRWRYELCTAATCWAREVRVDPHPTRAALVRLVVVRYDVAAYPANAA